MGFVGESDNFPSFPPVSLSLLPGELSPTSRHFHAVLMIRYPHGRAVYHALIARLVKRGWRKRREAALSFSARADGAESILDKVNELARISGGRMADNGTTDNNTG